MNNEQAEKQNGGITFPDRDSDGNLLMPNETGGPAVFVSPDAVMKRIAQMGGAKRITGSVDVVKEAARIGRQEEAPSTGEIGVRAAVFLNPRLSDNARRASLAKVVGAILHDLNRQGRFKFGGRVGKVLDAEQVYDTSADPLLVKEVLAALSEVLSEVPDGQISSHYPPKNKANQEDAKLSVELLDHLQNKVEGRLWERWAHVINIHNEYERGKQRGQENKTYSAQTDPETVDIPDTINPYAEFEAFHAVDQFQASLPEKEQAQFALFRAGMTPEQIAGEMGVSRSTVDNRKRKIAEKWERFSVA